MLDLPPMQTRQKVEQVKAYFGAVENPHNPLHEGMQTGRGQALDGSSRGLNTASMPADRAEANQGVGKVPKPIPASKILLSENLRNHTRMAGRQNRVIQENSKCKPQDPTGGSVTKDQSGWDFTVKQGATTIHEDNAAYTVSTSSLTMQLEAVTHALRWIAPRGDNQTIQAILLTDSIKGKPRLEYVYGGHQPLRTPVGCTALDMPE